MKTVSIVIPTLNEARSIPEIFSNLEQLKPKPHEVIVADGMSKDDTPELALQKGFKLIRVLGRGRALQMNEGALSANGEVLVFLHADTLVPRDLVAVVNETLEKKKISLAGFICIMKGESKTRWFISLSNYGKTYLWAFFYNPYRSLFKGFRFLFGDQVMFCRKSDFDRVGGFNSELPIMEDADLCIKMNQLGRIKQIKRTVQSSDRRVARWGSFRAYIKYASIAILWMFGASPHWLKSQYEDIR